MKKEDEIAEYRREYNEMKSEDRREYDEYNERKWIGTIESITTAGPLVILVLFIFSSVLTYLLQEHNESPHMEIIKAEVVGIDELLVTQSRGLGGGTSTRFQVVAQAEIDGELHIFYSERVRFNPIHQYPAGSIIEVRVNLDNPSSYRFRLS